MNLALTTPITLGTLIAWIESAGNPQAVRFEPTVYAKIQASLYSDKTIGRIRSIHGCTYETAAVIYSSSYGLYQIMGFNLYDPNGYAFGASIFAYMGAAFNSYIECQNAAFEFFVKQKSINYTPIQLLDIDARDNFALKYNGSLDYAKNILNALSHFGVH